MKPKTHLVAVLTLLLIISLTMGFSDPLTKREQGGLVGAGLGAGTGAMQRLAL